ncbi:hypothetical protein F5Y15DRAFT_412055 [Xylariaceae sp. FL0016]|nr:hypothetical protein F5Y15DRAFT_412055 [Xylariaceae sp. FL0016]
MLQLCNNGRITDLYLTSGHELCMLKADENTALFSWSAKDMNDSYFSKLIKDTKDNKETSTSLMLYWHPRFIPQWDEHIQGINLISQLTPFRHVRWKKPEPLSPDSFREQIQYCRICQLYWIAYPQVTHKHPEHHAVTSETSSDSPVLPRSMVVYVYSQKAKGKGPGFGQMGVYFGPASKYNHGEPIYFPEHLNTPRCADLHAVNHALLIMSLEVIPDCLIMRNSQTFKDFEDKKKEGLIAKMDDKECEPKAKKDKKKKSGKNKAAIPSHEEILRQAAAASESLEAKKNAKNSGITQSYHVERPFEGAPEKAKAPRSYHIEQPFDETPGGEGSTTTKNIFPGATEGQKGADFRLIICTANQEIVDTFCDRVKTWIHHEGENCYLRTNKPVQNIRVIADIMKLIKGFASRNLVVEVEWWHVPAKCEGIVEAKKLALEAAPTGKSDEVLNEATLAIY